MKNELLVKLKHKKEAYRTWKQGQVTREKYRDIVQASRDNGREANTQMELNLAKDVGDSKKGYYKNISDKRKTGKMLRRWLITVHLHQDSRMCRPKLSTRASDCLTMQQGTKHTSHPCFPLSMGAEREKATFPASCVLFPLSNRLCKWHF